MVNWQTVKHKLARPKYDFLDIGCKKGSSIGWSHRKYGGKGLGVDFNQEWVDEARRNGHDAIRANILDLDFPANSFRYISMMDFLEHLGSLEDVRHVLNNCQKWATDFFFIHHPSFEDIDYLKKFGLKIDWTDGYNHSCPITLKQFDKMFKEMGIKDYTLEPKLPIKDSRDKHILPIDAPHNTIFYDKGLGPKPKVSFNKTIYSRFEIFVPLK